MVCLGECGAFNVCCHERVLLRRPIVTWLAHVLQRQALPSVLQGEVRAGGGTQPQPAVQLARVVATNNNNNIERPTPPVHPGGERGKRRGRAQET